MIRRVVAAYTILCLLAVAVFAATPTVPTLVCRITGRSMTPVVANSETRRSCCAVAVTEAADCVRYALTAPGCCDLRFSAHGKAPLAVNPSAPDVPVAAILATAPTIAHIPVTVAIAAPYASARQDVPRGPPPRSCSPRAPPSIS